MLIFCSDPEPYGHQREASDLLPHQQVHQGLPGRGQRLRTGQLPRSQSGTVHRRHVPVPLRRDVR